MEQLEGDYTSGFLGDLGEKARITRKFSTAIAVRQQIALSFAEHDAESALSFYYDTKSLISNPEFRKQIDANASFFESQLLMTAVDGKSPKAMQFAAKSLDAGFKLQHVELLKKITAKDAGKGAEFGAAILGKLRSDKIGSGEFYAVSALLAFGDDNLTASRNGEKKAVYSESDLREIANMFGQAILERKTAGNMSGMEFADRIAKYAPGRAAQIRAKSGGAVAKSGSASMAQKAYVGNAAADIEFDEEDNYRVSASNSMSNSNSTGDSAAREARSRAEEKMKQDVMSLSGKEISKEEREKIIARARKMVAATPSREKKVTVLSLLANQAAAAGDKALAAEIMSDAAAFVSNDPKNYQDFIFNWVIAGGFAAADPSRAFPLLDDTIARANVTIDAFVKVAEFIDVSGEMVNDGEVQIGAFGGPMIRGLTGGIDMAGPTIKLLAQADFAKTKDLANKFDRPEVRILAKMLVLRTVLNDKERPAEISQSEY